jgi:hypothetical protein
MPPFARCDPIQLAFGGGMSLPFLLGPKMSKKTTGSSHRTIEAVIMGQDRPGS